MTKAAEQVLEQAMRLDPADRAELVDRLYGLDDSAAGPKEPGYGEAWAAELRERQAEFERDPSVGVPWQDVVARLRSTAGRGE